MFFLVFYISGFFDVALGHYFVVSASWFLIPFINALILFIFSVISFPIWCGHILTYWILGCIHFVHLSVSYLSLTQEQKVLEMIDQVGGRMIIWWRWHCLDRKWYHYCIALLHIVYHYCIRELRACVDRTHRLIPCYWAGIIRIWSFRVTKFQVTTKSQLSSEKPYGVEAYWIVGSS